MPYPQVQQKAPAFKCNALMPNKEEKVISLDDYAGKWVVLFFYPLDWVRAATTILFITELFLLLLLLLLLIPFLITTDFCLSN